ncbi:MAG: hypothetical protein R3F34_00200 [Planctomycetota bacterium]
MSLAIAGVVLTILVPGYLLARLVHQDGEKRCLADFLAVSAALGALAVGVVAQLLAWGLVWTPTSFFASLAVVCVAAVVAGRLRRSPIRPVRVGVTDLLAIALIWFLAARLVPAAQYVFGSADEGIYPNAAMEIVRSGGSTFLDPTLDAMPPEIAELTHKDYIGGFYALHPPERGWVTPHGLHMMPSFFAVLHAFGGRDLMLYGPLIFTIVALGAFNLLARRVAGAYCALFCTAVLGVNPITVWFSKITFAESMSEMFLLAGFAVFATAWPEGSTRREPGAVSVPRLVAAGLLLGAVNHAKIDFFLMPWAVLVGAVMLLWGRHGRRSAMAFVGGYLVMFVLAVLYAFTDHHIYYWSQFFNTQMYDGGKNAVMYLAGVFTPLLLTGAALGAPRLVEGFDRTLLVRRLTIVAGVLTFGATAYLYWLAPARVEWFQATEAAPDSLPWWKEALAKAPDISPFSGTPTFTEQTMSGLGLYVGALAVMLGVAGAFVLLLRRDRGSIAPFVLFFFAQTAMLMLISGKIDYTAAHPHSPGRRFLGISAPGCVLMSIVPWFLLAKEVSYGRYLRDAGVALAVYLLLFGRSQAWPMRDAALWDRTLHDVDTMAAATTPDTVLLSMVDDSLATRYQIPLRFFGGVKSLKLKGGITPDEVERLVAYLRDAGLRPVLLAGKEFPDDDPAKVRATELLDPQGYWSYQVTENTLTYTRGHLPRRVDFSTWRPTMEFHGLPAPTATE